MSDNPADAAKQALANALQQARPKEIDKVPMPLQDMYRGGQPINPVQAAQSNQTQQGESAATSYGDASAVSCPTTGTTLKLDVVGAPTFEANTICVLSVYTLSSGQAQTGAALNPGTQALTYSGGVWAFQFAESGGATDYIKVSYSIGDLMCGGGLITNGIIFYTVKCLLGKLTINIWFEPTANMRFNIFHGEGRLGDVISNTNVASGGTNFIAYGGTVHVYK